MTIADGIQARARKRHAGVAKRRQTRRYRRVLGRYVTAGLLTTNENVELNRDAMLLKDILWAGEVEPRLLELLPAMLVKRPALTVAPEQLPADLGQAVHALRRNQVPDEFRGLPGKDLLRWLPRLGHRDKLPSRLKSFRLQHDDTQLLERLQRELGISQTAILRRALRVLAGQALK